MDNIDLMTRVTQCVRQPAVRTNLPRDRMHQEQRRVVLLAVLDLEQQVFRDVIGVSEVQSGYIGGSVPDPTYKQVCGGRTGHAEAIRVTGEAKRRFTLADHRAATEGVECRKDKDVIDEIPMAYKDIDAVMEAQKDLVEIVHTLRQVVCVKG